MSLREKIVKLRERLNRALLGKANVALDESHTRESAERLKRIDEKLVEIERAAPRANGEAHASNGNKQGVPAGQ